MKLQDTQNNAVPIIDLEFEICGEKISELEWDDTHFLDKTQSEMTHAIHKIIMKSAWEIVSLEELRCQLIKNLHFVDLIKVKLDFSEKSNTTKFLDLSNRIGIYSVFDTISTLPEKLSNNLFCYIYYNEEEKLKTKNIPFYFRYFHWRNKIFKKLKNYLLFF